MPNIQKATDNMDQINLVPDGPAKEYLLAVRAAYPGTISNRALALGVIHAAMRHIPPGKLWAPAEETPPSTAVDTDRSRPRPISLGLAVLNVLVLGGAVWLYLYTTSQVQSCAARQQAQDSRMATLEHRAQEQEAAIVSTMNVVDKMRGRK
jgi:hypothetical protein